MARGRLRKQHVSSPIKIKPLSGQLHFNYWTPPICCVHDTLVLNFPKCFNVINRSTRKVLKLILTVAYNSLTEEVFKDMWKALVLKFKSKDHKWYKGCTIRFILNYLFEVYKIVFYTENLDCIFFTLFIYCFIYCSKSSIKWI